MTEPAPTPPAPGMEHETTRNIGRVRALFVAAPKWDLSVDPRDDLDDDIEVTYEEREGAVLFVRFTKDTGVLLATYQVARDAHVDTFYGKYSVPTPTHCYGSQLEVTPAARGRGLGAKVVRVGRAAAAEHYDRGVIGIIGRENESSIRCNTKAGFELVRRIDGIRFGGKVHWIRSRPA